MEQPYISDWMKLNYNNMSLKELKDLVHYTVGYHQYFAECKTKEDYVARLKKYVNENLQNRYAREEYFIEQQNETDKFLDDSRIWREERNAKKIEILRDIRSLKKAKLLAGESFPVADYELLCSLYENLFALSLAPCDRHKF